RLEPRGVVEEGNAAVVVGKSAFRPPVNTRLHESVGRDAVEEERPRRWSTEGNLGRVLWGDRLNEVKGARLTGRRPRLEEYEPKTGVVAVLCCRTMHKEREQDNGNSGHSERALRRQNLRLNCSQRRIRRAAGTGV